MANGDKLAIDGGTPVVSEPLPAGVSGPSVVDEEEISAITDLLRSQGLFRYRHGGQTAQFEAEAAEFLGVEHALMVNSGTSALICALTAVGVGPGIDKRDVGDRAVGNKCLGTVEHVGIAVADCARGHPAECIRSRTRFGHGE